MGWGGGQLNLERLRRTSRDLRVIQRRKGWQEGLCRREELRAGNSPCEGPEAVVSWVCAETSRGAGGRGCCDRQLEHLGSYRPGAGVFSKCYLLNTGGQWVKKHMLLDEVRRVTGVSP